jgi:hypothetical protein
MANVKRIDGDNSHLEGYFGGAMVVVDAVNNSFIVIACMKKL